MNNLMWNLVRPFHSPITRALRRRLGNGYFNHPEMELLPPYDAIQIDVERHLDTYLHVRPEEISQIVIVGTGEAEEIPRLRRSYPQARFLCFEPNPPSYANLTRKFQKVPYVTLSNLALSDKPGKTRFYEMDRPNNGSLLKPDVDAWSVFGLWKEKKMLSFDVSLSTLDQEAAALGPIDLLWMDVQGGEGAVLKGADKTLQRTKAIFLEVAMIYSPYQGTILFPEICAMLKSYNFTCVGMGIDGRNGSGNVLFVRHFDKLVSNELGVSRLASRT
jgi:FkbM family methyltransferase